MAKPLSPEIVANVLQARQNGEGARETAARLGITVTSVYNILAKNGVERRPMRNTADADDATKAAIQAAFRAGASIPEIAKQQARSTNNVRDILKGLGEKTPGRNEAAAKRHILTREQELAIIDEYYDVTKRPTITERWNLPDRYIYRILKRHAVKTDHRQYTLNEAAFDLPITPEAAYWAGFLMADGFITLNESRAPMIGLDLSVVDRERVEAFRAFLGAEHPITTRKIETGDSCRFLVRSQRVIDALAALGIVPGKTNHEKASDVVASSEDFWRGYWDGDGCWRGISQATCNGSDAILLQFIGFLKDIGCSWSWKISHVAGTKSLALNTEAALFWAKRCLGRTPNLARKQDDIRALIARRDGRHNEDGSLRLRKQPGL